MVGRRRPGARPGREAPADEQGGDGQGGDGPPADPESVARTICLNLLTTRARTRRELAEALARRGTDDEVAARVLGRLDEVGLVDDAAFAEQWVDSRHRHQGLGRRALADELHRKGVDRETATTAVDVIGRDDERARAVALVERRLPSLARFDDAVAARRLVGMLARKGYGAGVAYEVVREALAARSAVTGSETIDSLAAMDVEPD